MTEHSEQTLGRIAEEIPAARPFFESIGLDYCCGGSRTLDEACRAAGQPIATVEAALRALALAPSGDLSHTRWSDRTLAELVAHVVRTHHAFTRESLVRLASLLDKVLAAHGERHPELAPIDRLYGQLSAELGPHMAREEMVLFPRVVELERAAADSRPPAIGEDARVPLTSLVREHEIVGQLLDEGRRLSSGWSAPADGCATFRALYEAFAQLERDIHEHVHLENNVLFPRVLELEERTVAAAR